MEHCDVLIIGGGPAGSATAAHAARMGLGVYLADRARFPRDKACAEYLSPEAARDLDALGVLQKVEQSGAERLRGFRIWSDDGNDVVGRFDRTPFPPYRPWGYALPRRTLDPILLDAAREAGARVHEGTALEHLLIEGGTVRGALLRGPAGAFEVRCRAVVGADGLHSRVARELGVSRRRGPNRLALVTHLTNVGEMGEMGEMFAGEGWYVGVAPIGGGVVNAAMVVPQSDAAAIAQDAEAFLLSKLRGVPELARRLASASIVRRVMVTGPFGRRVSSPIADGALLVGDAADFFDPFTGEGIFAALRGGRLAAETLGAALASGEATRKALRPYARARRRAFTGKWVLERVVGLGATRPRLMRRFTRQLARRPGIADLWVGAAGDTVPLRALFSPHSLLAFVR